MGTPVSKSAENSLSETDTEFYSDRTDGHKTGNFSTRNREIHSAGDVIQVLLQVSLFHFKLIKLILIISHSKKS